METVKLQVEGMDCSNCALTIHRYLEKNGMKNVRVNPVSGEVVFSADEDFKKENVAKGIEQLGYAVVDGVEEKKSGGFLKTHLQRFWFCLPFTAVLMLHMIPGLHNNSSWQWLFNPYVQLGLTLPVYIVGMNFFGKSAYKSLRNGMPNMNVLIALGATAAFVYSVSGMIIGQSHEYLFFETAATIITLVFLGNYMEDASISSTQRELKKLAKTQKVMANMIVFDDEHKEIILPIENSQLKVGDLILIKSGEQVPIDSKILWGDAEINEAIITGESLPVHKGIKEQLVGGSIMLNGTVKAQVTATGDDTVLANILFLVKQAQGEKPKMQQAADRISAIFVPVVIGIAIITLVVNWMILGEFTPSLMRSIAVLVIACPCAMGLATPAAIAVGLGRGARSGILFRDANSLELFRNIKQVVFDKTGTLTSGEFNISKFETVDITTNEFRDIVYSLEKFSNHPLAKTLTREWKTKSEIRWKKIEEVKGIGMKGTDGNGNVFFAGSYKIQNNAKGEHNIYVTRNDKLIGWIDLADQLRPEAQEVINYFKKRNIKTILLSGDRYEKCKIVADRLGIDEIIAEQTPQQKLEKIEQLSKDTPTVMVGDGINDAPALAKATVGISMSDASQVALQSAQVVLMNKGLEKLPTAIGLGKHTYLTIKQNLFWAFAYNIVAIPVAALGFLTPTFGALVMGLSDVVLAVNSGRLFVKRVI